MSTEWWVYDVRGRAVRGTPADPEATHDHSGIRRAFPCDCGEPDGRHAAHKAPAGP